MDAATRWLALLATPGLGPRTLARLIERAGSAQQLLETPPATLAAWGLPARSRRWLERPDRRLLHEQRERLRELGARVIGLTDPGYPAQLRALAGAPLALFVRGRLPDPAQPQLAIVGSRNPSPAGRETARELAYSASKAGLVVTSGLAAGIDAAAHEGALAAEGPTVGVMATGPGRIYPAANRRLAEHILESGALVTEFSPGTAPRRQNFPRRNRIISGLTRGTLVVEAAPGSGSLITARLAAEQGRDVLAVPGSVHNPLSRGCHRLIRDGARLVETIEDVLEELGFLALKPLPPPAPVGPDAPEGLGPEAQALLEQLGHDPVFPNELVRRSGLTAEAVCSILFSLEINGLIEPTPGGAFVRVSKRPVNERKRS